MKKNTDIFDVSIFFVDIRQNIDHNHNLNIK